MKKCRFHILCEIQWIKYRYCIPQLFPLSCSSLISMNSANISLAILERYISIFRPLMDSGVNIFYMLVINSVENISSIRIITKKKLEHRSFHLYVINQAHMLFPLVWPICCALGSEFKIHLLMNKFSGRWHTRLNLQHKIKSQVKCRIIKCDR